MSQTTSKSFDTQLFKRLMKYTRPYRLTFVSVAFVAILLSLLSVARPYLLKLTVDDYIITKDYQGLLTFSLIMAGILLGEVISQLYFLYYANWIGQSIVRDIRKKLFAHMLRFKMKYYDNSSVGLLVTRTVSDMERIAEIFSSGFFEIVSDLLKMLAVMIAMLLFNWKLALIVFAVLPIILYATRLFQQAMKVAFTEVRLQVANLNSFVQERVTGMKIVQLFTREETEYDNFKKINKKHEQAWLKTVWYNSIFFPIAEITSSITIGLIVWYGGLQAVSDGSVELGTIFMFIQMSQMLFRPLRQIADKFNTLQMGMVAANRVFNILDTQSSIEDKGSIEATTMKVIFHLKKFILDTLKTKKYYMVFRLM